MILIFDGYFFFLYNLGGLVVANDVNNSRCYMLVHQAKRLNSANVVITNHDATVLPSMSCNDNGLFLFFFSVLLAIKTLYKRFLQVLCNCFAFRNNPVFGTFLNHYFFCFICPILVLNRSVYFP